MQAGVNSSSSQLWSLLSLGGVGLVLSGGFWLEGLVHVSWWMELNLVFLEGCAVSSSKFSVVYHLTCLLRNLYTGQEATDRTGHGTTDWFQIGKGVTLCNSVNCLLDFAFLKGPRSPVWLFIC